MVNGRATVPIIDLPLGRYLATTSFESDSYNVDTFSSYITIKSSIDAKNITKAYDSTTKFQATFYDFDGNVLKNTKVTFMLNGGLQTATTDNNGVASLDINLNPGTYYITSLNPITDETKINTIIIKSTEPQPIDDKDMDVPALPNTVGESVTVKLPSDATGTITLNIGGNNYNFNLVNVSTNGLAHNTYTATITFARNNNCAKSTAAVKVTVKKATQKITAGTKTFKKSVKTKKILHYFKNKSK